MKLVIDITNEEYEWIRRANRQTTPLNRFCVEAIANATPLPEGHGRLIDADYLYENTEICHSDEDGCACVKWKDINDALTVEVVEDCIDREEVRKLIQQNNDAYGYSDRFHEFTEKCLQLPPVTPQRPKGEWEYGVICPHCRFTKRLEHYNFCPNCGADMRGENNDYRF